jgi:hypothetical protein
MGIPCIGLNGGPEFKQERGVTTNPESFRGWFTLMDVNL